MRAYFGIQPDVGGERRTAPAQLVAQLGGRVDAQSLGVACAAECDRVAVAQAGFAVAHVTLGRAEEAAREGWRQIAQVWIDDRWAWCRRISRRRVAGVNRRLGPCCG